MIHVIPEDETHLHTQSQDCDCEPVFQLDDLSGEMYWFHLPLTTNLVFCWEMELLPMDPGDEGDVLRYH